ncbi:MAG: EAL domain-containing protein [Mycobacterium sp.]|nr:EAL domain-containing protein [Mycobacterium sp.]
MRTVYLVARLKASLKWWQRAAVLLVLSLAAMSWLGWMTDREVLTRIYENWPPMTPWTAALAAGLAAAILLQSEPLSRARVWMGRALAAAAAVLTAVFLAEYATGWSAGLDLLWFSEGVRKLQSVWPGRPSAQTSLALLLLAVAIGLTRVDRRRTSAVWAASLLGASAMSGVAVLAYFFGAFSLLNVGTSNGMSILTALSVAWLAAAASIARTDRQPVAWLLARPDRAALVQLAGVFAGAPLLTALVHGLAWRRGINEGTAWVVAVLLATAVSGSVAFFISERDRRRRQEGEAQLRSIMMHAPNAIAIRSVDHGYEFANQAFCDLVGLTDPDQIVGLSPGDLLASNPEVAGKFDDAQSAVLRGESARFEQDWTVDGRHVTFEVQMFPVDDGRGTTFGVGIVGTDITERVRIERKLRQRLEFEEFILRAINEGRLQVFAQPIVSAHTGQLVEEELLLRMVGPNGDLIGPDEFLPQAQRFGLMPTIDRFMVTQGIELARTGRRVAINLSGDSISHQGTISAIVEQLQQAGDIVHRISFEITESAALGSTDIAERFSNAMKSLGCKLALDDFGTGFGSFTELRGMTLHKLKIDKGFVRDLLANPQDESVVKMIIGIAKEFGLVTTAEGIENEETRTRLVELGVDQLQGHLIGAPEPATAGPAAIGAGAQLSEARDRARPDFTI